MIEITEKEYNKLLKAYNTMYKAQRKWREKNKEKQKEYMKKWQQEHKLHLVEYQRAYRKRKGEN